MYVRVSAIWKKTSDGPGYSNNDTGLGQYSSAVPLNIESSECGSGMNIVYFVHIHGLVLDVSGPEGATSLCGCRNFADHACQPNSTPRLMQFPNLVVNNNSIKPGIRRLTQN